NGSGDFDERWEFSGFAGAKRVSDTGAFPPLDERAHDQRASRFGQSFKFRHGVGFDGVARQYYPNEYANFPMNSGRSSFFEGS
ncbi:MAG TPA: hypothetical protein PKD54_01815, partial [Pirellulaceae bacterium]|nr:hypothetical protein [Pirellulaceae bacterium]